MSEPQRLGDILPEVLSDIIKRCERNPDNTSFGPGTNKYTDSGEESSNSED